VDAERSTHLCACHTLWTAPNQVQDVGFTLLALVVAAAAGVGVAGLERMPFSEVGIATSAQA
jgi:hypothetical protein